MGAVDLRSSLAMWKWMEGYMVAGDSGTPDSTTRSGWKEDDLTTSRQSGLSCEHLK